jgi:hypothetical protein
MQPYAYPRPDRARNRPTSRPGYAAWALHVVVVDKDAGSWFIVDSPRVVYDVDQNLREERPVHQDSQRSRWPPTITQLLWASGIAAVVFSIIVIFGYLLSWRWTGFGASTVPDHVQPAKTLWDWLDLLFILKPKALPCPSNRR